MPSRSGAVRESLHVEPRDPAGIARHYLRDLVYGANDGVITTFAVVGGVTGGALSSAAVLIVGAANLAADGMSMGVGNLVAIRANERARESAGLPEEEAFPFRHGAATLAAFVVAGAIPLLPFAAGNTVSNPAFWSAVMTFVVLFALGAARSPITAERWWKSGLENLALGVVVAIAAYAAGVAMNLVM